MIRRPVETAEPAQLAGNIDQRIKGLARAVLRQARVETNSSQLRQMIESWRLHAAEELLDSAIGYAEDACQLWLANYGHYHDPLVSMLAGRGVQGAHRPLFRPIEGEST